MIAQQRLLDVPMVGLYPVDVDAVANPLLIAFGHKLGPCHRPFRQEGFVLEVQGEVMAVAVSASAVSATITGTDRRGQRVEWGRGEAVELARLAASAPWVNRVMLRLWREACGPLWKSWRPRVAISYSHNAMHSGALYRFDGWERIKLDAGSRGRGGLGRDLVTRAKR